MKTYKSTTRKLRNTTHPSDSGLFFKLNNFLNSISSRKLMWFFILLGLFFDLISFNARISEAHDDALYIEAAYRFVNEFPNYFYTANAPFYPMFLAVLYRILGFELIVFKLFNVLFHLLAIYVFFKALKDKIPSLVFIPVLFFISINHHIVYFSSVTFTESLFMFLQALMTYSFIKWYDNYSSNPTLSQNIGYQLKKLISFGFISFLMIITRSGAIVILPAFLFFSWVVLKNKKLSLAYLISFFIFYLPYKIFLRFIFGNVSQYANQSKILLQKDPYDASLGQENILGFIQRFFDNSNLYLSKRFYQIIGWMSDENSNTYGIITFAMWTLFLIGLWRFFKQKKYDMFFITFYTLLLIILSFIILQARWDQPRIIMVAMPIMLISYLHTLLDISKSKFLQTIYLIIVTTLLVSIFLSTTKRGIKNIPIVLKNLQGDIYYGYTPDWQNFLKASEWCGKNLPPNAYVASRKAPMSFIYGKRKFFPIYSVIKKDPETNQSNPDSALAYFQQNGVTHILLANLRVDPTKNTGQVINTIHNILEPIIKKYPDALKVIHTEGETEPCYVYEINYNLK